MEPPSIFRRLSRYPRTQLDPRENRLTEAFAAVLERAPGLAAAVTEAWTDFSVGDQPPTVSTQRPTPRGFVDMELRFGDPADVVIWVESKLGAPAERDQLDRYSADIRSVGGRRESTVVLLAPAATIAEADLGRDQKTCSWQQVDRRVRSWLEALPAEANDERWRWLVDEFVTYLKEEGVAEQALRDEHVKALRHRLSSDQVLSSIMRRAEEVIVREWGDPRQPDKPRYRPGYWRQFDTAPRHAEPAPTWSGWFEWGFKPAEELTERPDELVWGAGVTFASAANPAGVRENEAWLAHHESDCFRYLKYDRYLRLYRHRRPDELLDCGTAEEQGTALGEWVVRAFADLAGDPPPEGAESPGRSG